jgi:hypothetical protein
VLLPVIDARHCTGACPGVVDIADRRLNAA